jgi:hypothetical protein
VPVALALLLELAAEIARGADAHARTVEGEAELTRGR